MFPHVEAIISEQISFSCNSMLESRNAGIGFNWSHFIYLFWAILLLRNNNNHAVRVQGCWNHKTQDVTFRWYTQMRHCLLADTKTLFQWSTGEILSTFISRSWPKQINMLLIYCCLWVVTAGNCRADLLHSNSDSTSNCFGTSWQGRAGEKQVSCCLFFLLSGQKEQWHILLRKWKISSSFLRLNSK